MKYSLNPPLVPRNGQTLRVLVVARISTINQDQQSLADQEALHRHWVADHYDGNSEFKVFATRGSGEWLDRQELLDIQREVDSRQYDLVLMEDLGRYLRGFEATVLCGMCVDAHTRLIAINDHIDTARDGWDDNALFAAWRHKRYNEDTSRRIKQRLGNRFEKEGGVFQVPIYGYIKPPGCKSEQEVQKDDAATLIYDHWFTLLEHGGSFAEVADWLNEKKVSTGPYCRSNKWTGKMVGRITMNPILKGRRERNRQHTVKHHGSGHRKSTKAPMEMLKHRDCPHLAHIEPTRFDRVTALIVRRNVQYKRKLRNGQDPLQGRPKKRTAWPGQHCYCGICKRMLVYGGHGQNDHLVCRGALEHKCWNAISFDGKLGAKKLVEQIRRAVEALPSFDEVFLEKVRKEMKEAQGGQAAKLQEVDRRAAKLARERDNLLLALRQAGPSPLILSELKRCEAEELDLRVQHDDVLRAGKQKVELPSMEKIKDALRDSFERVAINSQEFGRLMHKLIPRIVVYPHRLIDGGHPVLRARFTLHLAPLVSGASGIGGIEDAMRLELSADLFEPPQRETYRQRYLEAIAQNPHKKLYQIAEQDLNITATAVQRIAALVRLMNSRGITDPYEPLLAPPADYNRLRRYHHKRYVFEPLADFEDVQGDDPLSRRDAA